MTESDIAACEFADEYQKLWGRISIENPWASIWLAARAGYLEAVEDSKCGTNGCDRPRFDPKFMKCKEEK